jgi:hypothetical protein
MKAPAYLLGSALLFWGWQTGLLPLAIALALILEGERFVPWRVPITDQVFARIADFSTLLQLILVVYLFFFGHLPQALFLIFQWLPIVFAPLMIAQTFSTEKQIKLGALFYTLRKSFAGQSKIQMDPFYFTFCLFGAAAANVQTQWFYGALSILLAWALWSIRPTRYSSLPWLTFILLATGIGYAGHIGLSHLQSKVQESTTEWLADFMNPQTDLYQSSTHIGKLGMLKLSNKIVMRIKSRQEPPELLRDAAYNLYVSGTWIARPSEFHPLKAENKSSWQLSAASVPAQHVDIAMYSKGGKAVLALPTGTFRVINLPAEEFAVNAFGGAKVNGVADMLIYRAEFSPTASLDAPPTPDDLKTPVELDKTLSTISTQLHLTTLRPEQALASVERFFATNFKYTLFLGDAKTGAKSLDAFLLHTRAGHCEYFATATVLLLRRAGIPARYATGYSVQEYSPGEARYLVRLRHAHAWTLAYIGGHWREVDTTPATWVAAEKENESPLQPLFDLTSRFVYHFALWRSSEHRYIFMLPVFLLITFLLWRFKKIRKVAIRSARKLADISKPDELTGADSPFYRVIAHIDQTSRKGQEPLRQWIDRITPDKEDKLYLMLELHYRYRFDPAGLSSTEKDQLIALVEQWQQQEVLQAAKLHT